MSVWRVKSITASAQVHDGPCWVLGIHQEGTNDAATVSLANQATSGGTRVMGAAAANGGTDNVFPGAPTEFGTACYATLTGTTPQTEIWWRPKPG